VLGRKVPTSNTILPADLAKLLEVVRTSSSDELRTMPASWRLAVSDKPPMKEEKPKEEPKAVAKVPEQVAKAAPESDKLLKLRELNTALNILSPWGSEGMPANPKDQLAYKTKAKLVWASKMSGRKETISGFDVLTYAEVCDLVGKAKAGEVPDDEPSWMGGEEQMP
jgi:hypothetical protein